jgi:hypothetical protein
MLPKCIRGHAGTTHIKNKFEPPVLITQSHAYNRISLPDKLTSQCQSLHTPLRCCYQLAKRVGTDGSVDGEGCQYLAKKASSTDQ